MSSGMTNKTAQTRNKNGRTVSYRYASPPGNEKGESFQGQDDDIGVERGGHDEEGASVTRPCPRSCAHG